MMMKFVVLAILAVLAVSTTAASPPPPYPVLPTQWSGVYTYTDQGSSQGAYLYDYSLPASFQLFVNASTDSLCGSALPSLSLPSPSSSSPNRIVSSLIPSSSSSPSSGDNDDAPPTPCFQLATDKGRWIVFPGETVSDDTCCFCCAAPDCAPLSPHFLQDSVYGGVTPINGVQAQEWTYNVGGDIAVYYTYHDNLPTVLKHAPQLFVFDNQLTVANVTQPQYLNLPASCNGAAQCPGICGQI